MADIVSQFVAVLLDDQRYAVPLEAVQRVVHAVAITPLPSAPDVILGVVNFQGQIIPVVNVRRRFRLPERDIVLGDRIVIARTSRRSVALVVDAVDGIVDYAPQDIVMPETIVPKLEYIAGVLRLDDGMILVHDLDSFLSLDELESLNKAMEHV